MVRASRIQYHWTSNIRRSTSKLPTCSPFVKQADVVERRDHQGGRYLAAAVVLDRAMAPSEDLTAIARDLNETVRDSLGGLARPRMLIFVDRFGDELRGDERRRALASLPLGDTPEPKRVTWAQVLAAAEHLVDGP
jgi:acetyl-CoA synthetase